MNTYIYMDVSLSIITNFILQQNCFICFTKIWPPITKKNKVSQNLISWPKQTYGSLLVYQITPLLLLFTHRIVYYWKSAHQGTRGANSLSLGQGISAQFFSSQTLFVRCVGCRVQAQMWWGSYVFVLQRAFLLQEVSSTQRLYRKKLHLCHQTALYKSFYV